MSYTSVFGGTQIYPSDVSYLALALAIDTPLEWPLESSGDLAPAARIIDVTPAAAGFSIILPDATLTGAGQTMLFNNLGGTHSFFVKDFAGNTLATVTSGTQWQVYLAATTTAAGTWRVFRYGASTATVQPSALAGFGLTVTNTTLSQSLPVTTFSTSGLTVASSNRASAFVWTGTGTGTLNMPTAASVGNNFFVFVRNEGGGDLTVDPSGTESINSLATLRLRPGDSATVITDGTTWYTIGLGQQAIFAFDYTAISVTGGNYTLAGAELNRIAYKFIGTLTSDVYIIVPPTVQQYWVNNATSGAFQFFIRTASGTPTQVQQGAKGIYYCDGSNLVLGSDPTTLSTPIAVAQGGTGATTASAARLNLGVSTFADAIVTATTGASVRATIGAAASGANSDITSLTGLTTALSIAQGGTAATTAAGARTSLGATTLGGNVFTLTNPSAITFPRFNADNTVSALDAATFRTAIGAGTSSTTGTVTSVGGTGTVNGITLTGTVTSTGSLTLGGTLSGVSLTTQVSGTLPIANGGTNSTAVATAGGAAYGTGTAYAVTAAGTAGQVLTSAGAAAPTWATLPSGGTVTSVGGTGTVNGIALTGTVTSSGSLTLGGTLSGVSLTTQVSGTLPIANGGTNATTAGAALTSLGAYAASNPSGFTSNTGTVTSVSGAGSANGLSISGTVTTTGSLTLGGSVTSVASGATIDGIVIGYRNIPRSTTSGTAAVGDNGKVIAVSAGITIPNATFAAGDAVSIYNDSAAAVTITAGVTTLRQAGTTNTGNRTLAARGMATVWFNSGTEAVISGAGVT